MNSILNQNLFFIKEHVGMFKAANNFDILDPDSKEIIMTCRENNLGAFTKMFRFTKYKRNTPFNIEIQTASGEQVLRIKRDVSFLKSEVQVFDSNDKLAGFLEQKLLSVGGKLYLKNSRKKIICVLQGNWRNWEFKLVRDNEEIALVSKKWAGLGKELFTSADNYILKIEETVDKDDSIRLLALAAVLCIDMILKE